MKVTFLEVRNLDENDPMLLQPAPSVREHDEAYDAIGPTLTPTPIHPFHSVYLVGDQAFHDPQSAKIYATKLNQKVKEAPVMTLTSPYVEDPGTLVGTTADVLYNYRGSFMWITGGYTIHRIDPLYGKVNQYSVEPQSGDVEIVRLNLNGRPFHAQVQFN
jgi:hypothetical protein